MSSHQSPSSSSPSPFPSDCRPISHQIPSAPAPPIQPSGDIGSSTSSPPATFTPQRKEEVITRLNKAISDGDWEVVKSFYEDYKEIAQTAQINKSIQTALRLAIFESRAVDVRKLLGIVDTHVIRDMTDHRTENPLHLAASLGQTDTCKLLVDKDPELIGAQNKDGETPLFIAARNGKKGAFYALHPKCPITGKDIKHDIRYCKRNDGNTILHVSIRRKYFELAFQIIYWYPELIGSHNHEGQTALHLLAQNPSAFKGWCDMGVVEEVVYRWLIADIPKFEQPSDFKEERRCLDSLITAWKKVINAIVDTFCLGKDKRQATEDPNLDIEEQRMHCDRAHIKDHDREDRMSSSGGCLRLSFQSDDSWAFFRFRVLQFTIEHLLRVLGLGFIRVTSIKKKKQMHIFAAQVAEILVRYASDADSSSDPPTFDKNPVTDENDHRNPSQSSEGKDKIQAMENPNPKNEIEEQRMDCDHAHIKGKDKRQATEDPNPENEVEKQSKNCDRAHIKGKQRTPILIAAEMGVLAIVKGITDHHPMAIHQEDAHEKNALLLAVEHRQPKIYNFLLKKYHSSHSMFEKVDKNGNTALHLAATMGKKQQWHISSAAIQMQWDIKWYNFVQSHMPSNLLGWRNEEGKTSMEVFEETHEEKIKDGVAWLNSTSESCSVVAALIASVAYASTTTVPGGDNGGNGIPILKGQPAFNIFTIASLVAMCFSVTSLTMFLSILTSNYMIQDFLYNLPTKLLVGLTSLFISIGSMLASFCAGHFFNIGDPKQNTNFFIYAIMCLPVSAYALTQFHVFFSLVKSPF